MKQILEKDGFSTCNCLIAMIEKTKLLCDQGSKYTALINYFLLARAQDLLIAKFHTYGFDTSQMSYTYLFDKQIESQNKSNLSCVFNLSVAQAPLLNTILFNIFLCNLFLIVGDNTCYCISDVADSVKNNSKTAIMNVS